MPDPILYGPYNEVLTLPSKLDTETQAGVARVVHTDRWASREIRDLSPATLVRVLRNTADLGEMVALCDRVHVDGHFLSIATDRVSTVAGAEWDVLPYTDSPRVSANDDDKKAAGQLGAAPTVNSTFAIAASSSGAHAGFNCPTLDRSLLWGAASGSGVVREGVNWIWHFNDAGALDTGSVPWSQITSKPTTLSGYGITDGGPLLSTTTITPGGQSLVTLTESTGKPGSMPITEATVSSTTPVDMFSVSGGGRLRFLGVGHSTANGTVKLNIIVDGITRVSGASYSGAVNGITQSPLAVAVVGAISGSSNGTKFYSSPIPEEGFEFTTSLTVQAWVVSGTGYIGWSHRTYS